MCSSDLHDHGLAVDPARVGRRDRGVAGQRARGHRRPDGDPAARIGRDAAGGDREVGARGQPFRPRPVLEPLPAIEAVVGGTPPVATFAVVGLDREDDLAGRVPRALDRRPLAEAPRPLDRPAAEIAEQAAYYGDGFFHNNIFWPIEHTARMVRLYRYRFEEATFDVQRFEAEARATFERWSVSMLYGRYAAQPLLGFLERREGILSTVSVKLTNNWAVNAALRYDLDAHKLSQTRFGIGYIDDCLIVALNYITNYTYSGNPTRDDRIMLQLNLRTLGGTSISQTVNSSPIGPL